MSNNKDIKYIDDTNNIHDDTNIKDSILFINEIYDNLSFFDLYGNSVIIFIFVTLFVFGVFVFCKVVQSKEMIADDWINQRCKPQNMLFAGFITRPEGVSAFEYTSTNFQYCIQTILSNISNRAVEPYQYNISVITKVFDLIADAIQQIRELINSVRNKFNAIAEDFWKKILNFVFISVTYCSIHKYLELSPIKFKSLTFLPLNL